MLCQKPLPSVSVALPVADRTASTSWAFLEGVALWGLTLLMVALISRLASFRVRARSSPAGMRGKGRARPGGTAPSALPSAAVRTLVGSWRLAVRPGSSERTKSPATRTSSAPAPLPCGSTASPPLPSRSILSPGAETPNGEVLLNKYSVGPVPPPSSSTSKLSMVPLNSIFSPKSGSVSLWTPISRTRTKPFSAETTPLDTVWPVSGENWASFPSSRARSRKGAGSLTSGESARLTSWLGFTFTCAAMDV
mmetsp:Transcript_67246/g.217005  ORF Transcript_67246/g.217005 Transcript_67246/m.217005 type:complete len:251 (-) Transcript_67246:1098-1850(-)